MKAVFLPTLTNDSFSDRLPELLGKTLSHYSMEILRASNILVAEKLPVEGRILFLYENMPLLQAEKLLNMFSTVPEGYIENELVCMYWTFAEKATLDFSALKESLPKVPYTEDFLVVHSPTTFARATKTMQQRVNHHWLTQNVFLIDPDSTYIGPEVTIEENTIIYPQTYIFGKSKLGKNTEIGPNTRLTNVVVGEKTKITQSEIFDAVIGKDSEIGPFAYIRPNTNIGDHVKIGNFVEVKNARIGNHTKASHLAYIGDSDLGEHVNVGCGTVFVNFDGEKKHRSTVEDNVFIGCNANIIAPVLLGKNAYIAAGSTINQNVPSNALGIARSYQTNKENYKK